MNRELDGIYLRIKRDGVYQPVCLSDMTEQELKDNLNIARGEWLKGAVIHLALTLHAIGDQFGIEWGKFMDELYAKLNDIPDTYFGFVMGIMAYAKTKPERLDKVLQFLNETSNPTSSDVVKFVMDQPDFHEHCQ